MRQKSKFPMRDIAREIVEVPFKQYGDDIPEMTILDLTTFWAKAGHIARLPHRLKFYQILFVSQGEGTHWIDFNPFPYRSGALFPIEKGQVQIYEPSLGLEGYLILFTEQYLYRFSTDLEWLFNLTLFNSYLAPSALYLSPADWEEYLALINTMRAELTAKPDFVHDDILRNLLRVFVLKAERVKRTHSNVMLQDFGEEYDLFIRFRANLENSYTSSRSVENYASALAITPKKLNKITQMYLGKTTKQTIDERIVLEIKRLLLHSHLTIQEIAQEMGFSDPTNMIKFFKRYTQFTPVQFKSSSK
ncbi:MAG TPA: helix-turn-helix transcriptional regulator [Anaerolineae bacterium]|nr:helix-turn-helix transcriptional regulator [Anaerolineae bacterium]